MKVNFIADVGNSLIKWSMTAPDAHPQGEVIRSITGMSSLPPDDEAAWEKSLAGWATGPSSVPLAPSKWLIAGVHPQRRDSFAAWLRQRGSTVHVIESAQGLPLRVSLPEPDKVGIDRLLNAVAANDRVQRAIPKIIIDAGSAVTVDWVDAEGVFGGGAIFPGVRLMTQGLHDYTALLPVVPIQSSSPAVPGTSTSAAIEAGVFWAVAGGIKALVRQLLARADAGSKRAIFLTGGDARLLAPVMDTDVTLWPEMTLQGLRLTAEALP